MILGASYMRSVPHHPPGKRRLVAPYRSRKRKRLPLLYPKSDEILWSKRLIEALPRIRFTGPSHALEADAS
jgi:hypothetical protein